MTDDDELRDDFGDELTALLQERALDPRAADPAGAVRHRARRTTRAPLDRHRRRRGGDRRRPGRGHRVRWRRKAPAGRGGADVDDERHARPQGRQLSRRARGGARELAGGRRDAHARSAASRSATRRPRTSVRTRTCRRSCPRRVAGVRRSPRRRLAVREHDTRFAEPPRDDQVGRSGARSAARAAVLGPQRLVPRRVDHDRRRATTPRSRRRSSTRSATRRARPTRLVPGSANDRRASDAMPTPERLASRLVLEHGNVVLDPPRPSDQPGRLGRRGVEPRTPARRISSSTGSSWRATRRRFPRRPTVRAATRPTTSTCSRG